MATSHGYNARRTPLYRPAEKRLASARRRGRRTFLNACSRECGSDSVLVCVRYRVSDGRVLVVFAAADPHNK